jgi:hypothetical protein
MFVGRVLLASDVIKGATDDLPDMAAAVAQTAVSAGMLGGISMAVSAFTPRRAYAVAGIIALLTIPTIVAGIVIDVGSVDVGRWLVLLSPASVLEGTNALLFDLPLDEQFGGVDLAIPRPAYAIAAAAWIAVSVLLTVRRHQRITA